MAESKGVWAGVPPVVKGIIYLVGTAGAVWGTVAIVREVRNRRTEKGSREELKDIKDELTDLNKDASTRQTLSPSGASSMSNSLFTAMDGYGTDSTAIAKNLLRLKNQADWLSVKKAFGIKTISSGNLNPTPDFTGTLEAALTDELGVIDASVAPQLNAYFKVRKIDLVL